MIDNYVTVIIVTIWNMAAMYGAYCFWMKWARRYFARRVRQENLHRAIDRYV